MLARTYAHAATEPSARASLALVPITSLVARAYARRHHISQQSVAPAPPSVPCVLRPGGSGSQEMNVADMRLHSVLLAVLFRLIAVSADELDQADWFTSADTVTVTVSPPPESCRSTWADVATCNPIQAAINAASSEVPLVVLINGGTYYNQDFGQPGQRNNPALVQINNRHHVRLQPVSSDVRPKLMFDGSGGISLKTVSYISIRGLEIEGPAALITGCDASLDRLRRTSRTVAGERTGACSRNECSACLTAVACQAPTYDCQWDDSLQTCAPRALAYFSGNGIAVWPGTSNPHHLVFEDLWVHHCPGSGIRVNKGDNCAIRHNLVYDNTHWTVSASSGVVFAESVGTGSNVIANNIVYGNRNFMPFFYYQDITNLEGAHAAADGYSEWNQRYIIDGSGVYITRNQNYEGTFHLTDNVCFDNGINGLVVHKTNHQNVEVFVERNHLFDNGRTTRDVEGRQAAGGFVINNGHAVTVTNNIVATSVGEDYAFQCFGVCSVRTEVSTGNSHCTGQLSASFPESMFRSTPICDEDTDAVRQRYPTSTAPSEPQYIFFENSTGLVACESNSDAREANCMMCDDVPSVFMQRSDPPKVCATWEFGLSNNCGIEGNFASSGSCRASCFHAGQPLDASDNCCRTEAEPNAGAPATPPAPSPSTLECPAGSGPNVELASCEMCPEGQYSTAGICQTCAAPNVVSSDQTTCEPEVSQEQELVQRAAPPPSPEKHSVRTTVMLDTSLDDIGSVGDATYSVFTLNFKTDVAVLLNVNVDRLRVNSVTAGSVIVDFTVLPGPDGEPVATSSIISAFAAPGVAIAGVTTLSTIDHSLITVTTSESVTSDAADSQRYGGPPTATEQDETAANVGKGVVLVLVMFGLCACVIHLMGGMATDQKHQHGETQP